jgi:hypothetical protein
VETRPGKMNVVNVVNVFPRTRGKNLGEKKQYLAQPENIQNIQHIHPANLGKRADLKEQNPCTSRRERFTGLGLTKELAHQRRCRRRRCEVHSRVQVQAADHG